MKRTILGLIFTTSMIFSANLPQPVTATLDSVENNKVTILQGNLTPGMSGIVIHKYDETHEAIVATAEVEKSNGSQTTLLLSKFEAIQNKNLPNIKTKPQKGDRIILGQLYNRVLPIVPNQATFQKVKESFSNFMIVHPDIFAVELSKDKKPLPEVKDFRKVCKKMNIGLVMFVFKDGSDFIDCNSWKKIYHTDISYVEGETVEPFYNRIGEIPEPIFDWSSYKLGNFDAYYQNLEKRR
ncbi:plasminogen-binding N-terminal domain-containing protein [Hydrogenimonas thermophila]|uniref:Plasminogen-binding protein pgbA N-terminal n=1 Tax=Hydrogenimonas thermophila TaxID=223786 RepID=A0A1I5TIA8_9BACT|nr:plasminogen-binding N-terminal domain-containing protein [Hydrogenimonas thermophila]SFP82397.1 Plasminogen-binding protein pgbA N-terminal [Hydrogenimonas thermophila]